MRLALCMIAACAATAVSPGYSQEKEGFSLGNGESRATVTAINGNPLRVNVGSDNSFQVFNASIPGAGQIYPSNEALADFGWMLRVGSTLFTPDFRSRPSATAGLGMTTNFSEVSTTPVTGNGSATTPFSITVTARAGTLNLTQVVSYVNGENFFRKQMTVNNTSAAPAVVRAFLGADIFLASSDSGRSQYFSASGAVGGLTCAGVSPTYNILLIPQSTPAPTAYTADSFSSVWSQIGAGMLPSTVSPSDCVDNGAALQWDLDVPAGGSAVIRAATSFGELPTIIQPPAAAVATPVPTLNMPGVALLAALAALGGLVVLRRTA
ncbi:MAG: hypothetical protein MUE46_08150 [Xanthomonadales bacterium]|jgi:hypothetical protein|nr:hypothetical protein [Xanthomonadales bacterium]